MSHAKLKQVSLVVLGVYLLLVVVLRPWSTAQPAVLVRAAGIDDGAAYLPIIRKPFPFTTIRVSISSDGVQGNANSSSPSISADGRYVAFSSWANNLVSDHTNNWEDVFVHDRQASQTIRISVASGGNYYAQGGYISADGRFVVYRSNSNSLVSGGTNGHFHIFVYDMQTQETRLVSVASDGTQGNDDSTAASISADGRYVTFSSLATNLVSGDTNGYYDVFVHDMQTGQTSRVSVASDGTQGNHQSVASAISADGRYVAFWSAAFNLVSGDSDGYRDIFVHDRQTGQTSRVSVASDGTPGNENSESPSISADGRFVAFQSFASNLVNGDSYYTKDIFVHDRQTGQTSLISVNSDGLQANGSSEVPFISASGRYVVFRSNATNLVSGDTNGFPDLFIHDRQTGQTSRVSIASDGSQSNEESWGGFNSADGRFIGFMSWANNLVNGDTNDVPDAFIHDRGP